MRAWHLASQKRVEARFGCSYSEYLEIRDLAGKPTTAFSEHRSRAKRRGVGWELSLAQWWNIWNSSGFWEQRGRGVHCYCMCRKGDVGPYAVGNVFIALSRENSSVHPNKKCDLPMGVREPRNENSGYRATRTVKGKTVYIGTFATPDMAGEAYLASIHSEENRT